MTSQHYQVLSRRIYNNFPLIGWLLRRWTAKRLARDGSGEAITILADAITRSRDQVVKDIAFPVLKQLKSQDAINGFCRIWVETRHKDLTSILKNRRYIGTEPKLKVLSALKVGSLNTLKTCGIEILDFLLAALNDKDTQIASVTSNFIVQIENRAVIDELCKRWVDSRSSQLEQIIQRGGYSASQPIEVQVLIAFKFKQIVNEKIEVIDCLVNAINDKDVEIVNAAKSWATKLKKQQTIDTLCRKWIDSQNTILEAIIQKENYEPSEPSDKALFFFLLGNWQKYEDLDFDQSLLLNSYKRVSTKTQKLIADKAKSGGRIEWIKILTIDEQDFNIDEVKDEDWIACIDILAIQSDEKEIWNFLRNAPAIWSKKLIDKLVKVSHNWLKHHEEFTVKNLLTLSAKSEEESFTLLQYLLIQPSNNKILTGHTDSIKSLAITPDSLTLVSGSWDGTIRLWSLPDGNHIKTLTGHTHSVMSLAITPDSLTLVSGSWDGTIRLWSLPDGNHIKTLTGLGDVISCLAISPDGHTLAIPSLGIIGSINLWSLPDGNHLKTLEGHNDVLHSLAISPDGRTLVSSSVDKTICLWNLPDGNHLKTLIGHTEPVNHVAISSDSHTLASSDGCTFTSNIYDKKSINLWSLPDGNHIKTLTGHTDMISSIAMIPNSQTLISSSSDEIIRLWSLFDGLYITHLTSHNGIAQCLAVSPDNRTLACGISDQTIYLYNLTNIPISKLTDKDITKIESHIQSPKINKCFLNTLEFTHALFQLRRDISTLNKGKAISTEIYTEKEKQSLKSAEVLFNIGNTKFSSGNIEGALANFSESIKLNPNSPNAFFNRGNVKYILGDKQGAINDYSEAIRINPQFFDAWYGRGVSKFDLRDFQGAFIDHNEAIRINPKFANAYFGRGNAKRALGDKDGANIDQNIGFGLQ
jgi:WD40 repeat protein